MFKDLSFKLTLVGLSLLYVLLLIVASDRYGTWVLYVVAAITIVLVFAVAGVSDRGRTEQYVPTHVRPSNVPLPQRHHHTWVRSTAGAWDDEHHWQCADPDCALDGGPVLEYHVDTPDYHRPTEPIKWEQR
jgi:hypothetical protein